jgi:hypothetical protein
MRVFFLGLIDTPDENIQLEITPLKKDTDITTEYF